MGRIKTVLVKRITQKLIKENPDKFSTDFTINKKLVSNLTDVSSIKMRNIIAGYATRLVRQRNEPKTSVRRLESSEDLSKFYK